MFDFDMKDMAFGQQKEAHGKKWIVVRPVRGGIYLAIDMAGDFPAQVQLIKVDEEFEKAMEMKKLAEESLKNETK